MKRIVQIPKGIEKLEHDAQRGGRIAGVAKKELEKELGKPIVSGENFLEKKDLKKYLV